jgi:co-chaperonin GroES (HSP10)
MNPYSVRPRDGWVVVLADPRKDKTSGGIYVPTALTGVEKVTEGAGRIIRVGPGKKNHDLGLETDLRVVYRGFLKYANPIETEEKWANGENKVYFIMSSEDLLAVLPPGVEVGVFSGRPQVPHKE